MGFSSFPIFLDPPNWSQMQQQPLQCLMSGGGGSDHDHHHHLIPPPSSQHQQQLAPLPCNNNPSNTNTATSGPPPSSLQHQQPSSGDPAAQPLAQAQAPSAQVAPSSGVTSMTERARLARVPLPEPGTLRCPRCDSANTKFCYFNNYSLSQPRHFCKACRRYWTRGGALRNVPVGGGCRRNTKRSNSKKSSRSNNSQSQSQATSSATSSCSTTTATSASTTSAAAMQALPHHLALQLDASLDGYHGHHAQLQFLPAFMQQQQQGMMMQHGGHGGGYGHFADGGVGDVGSAGQQQLPDGFPRGMVASGLLAQLASIKMEEHGVANGGGGIGGGGGFQLGLQGAHEQYWPGSGGGGGGWPTEFLSGFSSSSSGNVL